MRTLMLIPLAALFLLLAAVPATATIVIRAGVEDLTDKATVVVRGEVAEVKSLWNEDHSTIQTRARIRVAAVLKGEAGAEIVATCPGGRVGGDHVSVHGVPAFEKGEEVVVFLWKNRDGDYLPLGLNQGMFRIETDPQTGERTAKNSLKGLSFVAAPNRATREQRSTEAERRPDVMPVAKLEQRIRDRLDAIRRGEVDPDAPVAAAPKTEEAPTADEAPKADGERPPETRPAEEAKPAPVKSPDAETREEKKAEPAPVEQPVGKDGK